MANDKAAEAVIEMASQLRDCVRALCTAYRARPPLIEREERAIKEHDFPAIMALRDEYESLNERVEFEVTRLRGLAQKLVEWRLRLVEPVEATEATVPANVSEIIIFMREVSQRLQDHGVGTLANSILQHLINGIQSDWESFVQDKLKIEKLIQRNHTLLEVLVDNYQKSYQFWYETVERCSSSYNAKGQQSSGGVLSGFSARA